MANKHWTKLPLVVAIAGAFVSPLSQAEESVTGNDGRRLSDGGSCRT